MGTEGSTGMGGLLDALARGSAERRARARAVLAAAGLEDVLGDAGQRASRLAEDLLHASRANRRLVENLVGQEVARAADRWGFVRSEELEELRREVDELRVALVKATLAGAGAGAGSGEGSQQGAEAPVEAPKQAPRKRTSTKSAGRATGAQQHPLGGVAAEAVAPEPEAEPASPDDSGSHP